MKLLTIDQKWITTHGEDQQILDVIFSYPLSVQDTGMLKGEQNGSAA